MKKFPYYTLLFAIYPILLAWSINVSLVSIVHINRILIIVVTASLAFLFLLWFITKDWLKTGLITTLFIVSILYYGYFTDELQTRWSGSVVEFHRIAVSVIAIVLIVGSWAIWRILKPGLLQTLHNALTAVVLILLVFPTFQIVSYLVTQNEPIPDLDSSINTSITETDKANDIYYIVLDEYVRDDILNELFNYDNTPFLNALRDKGFFVASESSSNYSLTTPSITSSLNMDYIQNLTDSTEDLDVNNLTEMLHNSRILQFMAQEGYQIIAFDSGYPATQIRDVDAYLSYDAKTLNQFEIIVMQNSLPGQIFMANLNYETHRQRILYTFSQLAQLSNMPGKKFVFAHIITPHAPFVFDAEGNKLSPAQHYSLDATTNAGMTQETYIEGYREQIQYVNFLIEQTVTEILENSETPPIIIIQGDHGTRTFSDWESVENSCLKERMSIFNAYYFPEENDDLYDTISPVNTFRVILNNYFEEEYEMLPDKNYFSLRYKVNNYIEITDDIESSCESHSIQKNLQN